MKPQYTITKSMTKSYQSKLDKVVDILSTMSAYIERRQVIDTDDLSKKELRLLNEVMKIDLDFDHVTSINFLIPAKKNAIKAAAAMSLLLTSIKDQCGLSQNETEILLDGFAYLPDFNISINKLYGNPQSDYSFKNSIHDRIDIIFWEGLGFRNYKHFGANGNTWAGHYVFEYQYAQVTDSDMKRFDKAVVKHELEQKKKRSLSAKKAAVTRKENKIIAEQQEVKRLAWVAQKAKDEAEHQANLSAWDADYRVTCADAVAKIKHDIAEYIAANPDCAKALYIDTETTFLDDDRQVVEIAIVDSDENVIVDTLVNNYKIVISIGARGVHSITEDDLDGKPRLIYFEQDIMNLLKDREVYFYNHDFDMLAIRNSASDNFSFESAKKIGDVMYRFARVYGEMPHWAHSYTWQTLATACEYYGIEQGNHRALSDAIATCRVHAAMSVKLDC